MLLEDVVARLRAGDPRSALAVIESAKQSRADPRIAYLAGVCRHGLGDAAGALTEFEHAIAAGLASADCQHAAAVALEDLGRPEEALARYRKAIATDPRHADARHNHGLLLARLGRREEALRSHEDYAAALPDSARAHADVADVLLSLDRNAEALQAAQRAWQRDPRNVEAAFTAGLACALLERFDDANAWIQRSRAADSARFDRLIARQLESGHLDRDLDPRAIFLIRGFDRLQGCDWSEYDRYVSLFRKLVVSGKTEQKPLAAPPLIFRSLAVPMPVEERRILADGVARRLGGGIAQPLEDRNLTEERRIRIGYVSPDFGTHPTGILSSPLFALHDRARFEVHAFSMRPDDGSEWRRRVVAHADRFHEMQGLSLQAAKDLVRGAGMDILVDLAGATTGAMPELFAQRSAPIQASYLGFPGTTGRGYVDYLVCDPVCVPESESDGYAEALIRLPDTFWMCDPGPDPGPPPSRHGTGLPEDAFVLYAHHPGQKITPGIFEVWMGILRAVPFAVLWLLADRPDLPANLRREAQARGIAPQRLVFAERVPYEEYRRRIPLAHLALDTPVYNGGATTLDALACGLPVLTCPGQGFAGRMAASALLAADLGDLVAGTLEEYKSKAIAIARQRDTLAALVARLKRARTTARLFDVAGRVRQLEEAYVEMLRRGAPR